MRRPAFPLPNAWRRAKAADPPARREGKRPEHDRTLFQIARGLTWIGGGFLVASAAVIVWAVFRTVGVDDLLVALTVAGLGLGLPAIVAFVVAWILNSLGHPDAESDWDVTQSETQPPAVQRSVMTNAVWGYAVAVLACTAAWGLRILLDPLLGQQVTYAPLLLSVAFAAWYGGLGPAVFATVLGAGIAWFGYLSPRDRFGALDIEDTVQLGLYCAAALCIGAIASALRASRERAQALAREGLARQAGLERARAELAAERDRFEVTLQSIADAVIATDGQGNVTFANESAAALTGWPMAEAIGKPFAKVFRALDEHTRRNLAIKLDGGGQDETSAMVLVARDGTERAVEPKVSRIRGRGGSSGGYVIVFRDITEARHARAALEESEARFRVMADQMPLPVWMSDTERRYVYVNRAWLAFTGRTVDEELGDGWTVSIHPEDFGPRQAAFAEAFDARKPFTLEYRLRRHDGAYRFLLDHGAPRFDGVGQFAGYMGACLDVTERKQAAATLGVFEQRKSAFLASLAHELRNPLAPIQSSVELLRHIGRGSDTRATRAQEIIERNCARLAALVDDLLDLSRIDSGNIQLRREPVEVGPVIERAVARHAAALRDRAHQIALDVPSSGLRVAGDAERIEQIVGILVGNASSHTPREGRIAVAARAAGDDAVEIAVADTGEGIDPARAPALFELFDHAGETGAGTEGLGTGLAIVARLARLLGGSVRAESEGRDRGSTFVLRLPRAGDERVAGSAADEGEEARERPVRLLVVDDNVDAADAIGTLLTLEGFDVAIVHDPGAAIERACETEPDVILLDIGLPGMTGYELARKLRAGPVKTRAKLVAITGYGQAADTEMAREAGFDGYLVKPVDLAQLKATIDSLLPRDAPRPEPARR
jgi:PAS domain S-box-containing protein